MKVRLFASFVFLGGALTVRSARAQVDSAKSEETSGDSTEPNATEGDQEALPPVPVDELTQGAPTPSWDTGYLLAACGVGQNRLWEKTRFCLGGLVDVMWARQNEKDPGAGAYLQLATSGFRDFRPSLGVTGIVSLIEWFTLSGRAGGLLRVGSEGTHPGLEGYLELGHRSVSHRSHYALSHALFGGVQWVARSADQTSPETCLWIGVRIDGVWTTAPKALF